MNIREGDVIQFVTKVNHSNEDQPIQNVILKVQEFTATHISGYNAMRTIEASDRKAYRTYLRSNIVKGTLWKLLY